MQGPNRQFSNVLLIGDAKEELAQRLQEIMQRFEGNHGWCELGRERGLQELRSHPHLQARLSYIIYIVMCSVHII